MTITETTINGWTRFVDAAGNPAVTVNYRRGGSCAACGRKTSYQTTTVTTPAGKRHYCSGCTVYAR